jgi:hypothetical protein
MNLLVNSPGQRGEAHVDNAPVSLLLYPQPATAGGRLIISADTSTVGYNRIAAEGLAIDTDVNTCIIFRGDNYVHVSESVAGNVDRVALNMNYHLPGQLRDTSLRDYFEYHQE